MKLKESIQKAWENRKQIVDGLYYLYLNNKSEFEQEFQNRKAICETNQCGYYDIEGKPENSVIPGKPSCKVCHCNIEVLTHCPECTCSLNKIGLNPLWEAVMTEEQSKEIRQKEWEEQFKK